MFNVLGGYALKSKIFFIFSENCGTLLLYERSASNG